MSQQCEVKRIQQNSAQQVVDQAMQARDQAKQDYLQCLGPAEQGAAALADAQGALDQSVKEAEQLLFMNGFILKQLQREANNEQTLISLAEIAEGEANTMQGQIDELKTQIRTQRRRFLDSGPQVSPAAGGLYFTKVPDNQVLIAFLSCYGAFLLFVGLLIIMNQLPISYFDRMTMGERAKLVITMWLIGLGLAYVGFYVFT